MTDTLIRFSYFSHKIGFDISCERSPSDTIWNGKSYFPGKIRKKIFLYSSFFPSSSMRKNNALLLLVNNDWLLKVLENMFCHKNVINNGKRISRFLTGTKETNHINFCKITCSLSEDSYQAAHRSLISLCYLDEEAVNLKECVAKTDKTVQMCKLIWIFTKHTD